MFKSVRNRAVEEQVKNLWMNTSMTKQSIAEFVGYGPANGSKNVKKIIDDLGLPPRKTKYKELGHFPDCHHFNGAINYL